MIKTPELLAPAGNLDTAVTAFRSGADAVYAGLFKFNARERTENFTLKDFGKLMAYAGKNNKKVYLTFNTLVKENEILEAFDNLKTVTRLLPDAVIVQDPGVVHMLRTYFPHIPVHASTQMGIHNHAGVEVAKNMGMERVILERQVTLEEIKLIKKASGLELEVFIHGALCCSLSGVCLFSSWMGGHSGNRGKCKQPCRRRYFSDNGNGFFFSTQDLYSLEHIPELSAAGIDSLKIEGRLRKSDYVESVVSAYRLMLDHGHEEGVLSEAKNILSGSLGRRWTHGFATESDIKTVVDPTRLGVSGKQCGNVISLKPNGFIMSVSQTLFQGDKIRIQPQNGDEGPALTVTRMSAGGQIVKRLVPGQKGLIFCDKEIPRDGMVFRIGRSHKDNKKICDQLPPLTDRIDLSVSVQKHVFTIKVLPENTGLTWLKTYELEDAQSRALDLSALEKEFLKSGSDTLQVRRCSASIDGQYYLSQRDLRHIRQEFSQWLIQNFKQPLVPALDSIPSSKISIPLPRDRTVGVADCHLPQKIKVKSTRTASRNSGCRNNDHILPAFCFEKDLPMLRDAIEDMIRNGQKRFRITSLFQLACLPQDADVELLSHFPVPVCNHLAARQLKELGIRRMQLWPELEKPVLDHLCTVLEDDAELFVYGAIPILQTRALLPAEGAIQDGRGGQFFIKKDFPVSYLYPGSVFDMTDDTLPPVSLFYDDRNPANVKNSSRFNLDRELV